MPIESFKGGDNQIDELIYKRGASHQTKLAEIADKFKLKFDENELFNDQTQKEIDDFASQPEISQMLEKVFNEIKTRMSLKAPGHDLAHIMDNLDSALRIFHEYQGEQKLSEGEKLEVVLACLSHDMGRFLEKRFEKIDAKDLSFLAPAMVGRDLEKKGLADLPESLSLRVLYDIFSNSKPITGHRTADAVHQCDREQLIGSATIARGLAFDVGLGGRDLAIPLEEKFKRRLPTPETADDRYWLIQYEFFMRNLYNPTSPGGVETANKNKQENAVILMLGLEGKPEEYQQVFGPELGLVKQEDEGVHWSKKPIPPAVYEAAKEESPGYLSRLDFSDYKKGREMDLALELMKSDEIEIPQNFEAVLLEKLEKCTEQERKNFWAILKYSLEKRHQKRQDDLQDLKRLKTGIERIVSGWVSKELEEREKIYDESRGSK